MDPRLFSEMLSLRMSMFSGEPSIEVVVPKAMWELIITSPS